MLLPTLQTLDQRRKLPKASFPGFVGHLCIWFEHQTWNILEFGPNTTVRKTQTLPNHLLHVELRLCLLPYIRLFFRLPHGILKSQWALERMERCWVTFLSVHVILKWIFDNICLFMFVYYLFCCFLYGPLLELASSHGKWWITAPTTVRQRSFARTSGFSA